MGSTNISIKHWVFKNTVHNQKKDIFFCQATYILNVSTDNNKLYDPELKNT